MEHLRLNETNFPSEIFKRVKETLEAVNNFFPEITHLPVILSGAAVFLYQYDLWKRGVSISDWRAPTDLDLVVFPTDLDSKIVSNGFDLNNRVRETRFGFNYVNSIWESRQEEHRFEIPVDLMMVLNTLFPENNQFFPNQLYSFPDVFGNKLYREIEIDGAQFRLASPTLILFYKITQMREGIADNGTVKQDLADIKRLHEMGLFNDEDLNTQLDILTYGNGDVRKKIIEELNRLTGGNYQFIDFVYESNQDPVLWVDHLSSLADILNRAFGEGNWVFSNGTALFLHGLTQGRLRIPTDIDIFINPEGLNSFPQNFFDVPFGIIGHCGGVTIGGIEYLDPQLRGFIRGPNGKSVKVDIIGESHIRKGQEELTTTWDQVRANSDRVELSVNGNNFSFPVMGLSLLREIKKFLKRLPPKTDLEDLSLIELLERNS